MGKKKKKRKERKSKESKGAPRGVPSFVKVYGDESDKVDEKLKEIIAKEAEEIEESAKVAQAKAEKTSPSKPKAGQAEEKTPSDKSGGDPQDEVAASLSAIYEGHPSKEWLNTLEHGRRKTWTIVLSSITALLVLVIGAAWLGFWWWGGHGFSGEGIEIQIEGPDRISVGQEVSYFINWFNVSNEPLASTEFRISFPNDFIISEIDPEPTSEPLVFRLGAQSVEARGTIKVTGMFTGALGTKSAIQVIGTYRPATFNSDFEQLTTKEIEYTDSVLEGTLDIPAKVLPGDEVTIRYTIENRGSETMEGLRARIPIPEGFVPSTTGTTEELDEYEYIEELEPLESEASVTVELKGSFSLGSSGDIEIIGEAGYVAMDGNFAAAQKTEGTVSVLAGDLHIELVINGSQDDRSVNLGEWQRIGISYENTSGEELKEVSLALYLDAKVGEGDEEKSVTLVDWRELDDEYEAERSGNALTFTDVEIEALEALGPDEDGFIEVSVPVIESVSSDMDVPIMAYVEATIVSVGETKVNRVVKTQPILLKLQSDASIESVARYTSEEGAPVGTGPLPPQVGSATTYRVEWKISKTLHELERVNVSASLPKAISWDMVKEIDAGEAEYDPELKLVTWNINKIPEDVDELLLSFDVKLSPSEADVGRFAKLLSETRFEFTDKNIEESVIRTASSLNTDLPDDPIAKRKGVITKP
jgi:hypothetical protein